MLSSTTSVARSHEIAENAACLKNAEKYFRKSVVFLHITTVSKIVFPDLFSDSAVLLTLSAYAEQGL